MGLKQNPRALALLQRGSNGTYISVEPYHLAAYVDEQSFRFNNRKDNDSGRLVKELACAVGAPHVQSADPLGAAFASVIDDSDVANGDRVGEQR